MAETDFILTEQEQANLIEFLLSKSTIFVPCFRYLTKKIQRITVPEDVLAVIASNKLEGPLVILSKEFSIHPLVTKKLDWQGETRYFIEHRYGGPYLEMLPSCYLSDRNPPLLTSGFIAYYKSYYIGPHQVEIEPSAELRSLYRSTVKFLQRTCVKHESAKARRRYLIAPLAREMIVQGTETNVQGLRF